MARSPPGPWLAYKMAFSSYSGRQSHRSTRGRWEGWCLLRVLLLSAEEPSPLCGYSSSIVHEETRRGSEGVGGRDREEQRMRQREEEREGEVGVSCVLRRIQVL